MKKEMLIRSSVCLFFFSFCLYSYLNRQNEVTQKRLALPQLQAEVQAIGEENIRLLYEIERFESPAHLQKLAMSPEYRHLKSPYSQEVISMTREVTLAFADPIEQDEGRSSVQLPLAVGAKR